MIRIILALALLIGAPAAWAQLVDMVIPTDADFVNMYPGADGLIGNADDVASGALTPANASAPNRTGSAGHNSFLFGNNEQDAELPTGFDALTFVSGGATLDTGVLTNGGGAVVSALNLTSGTEPFPGHGEYTATVMAVNSGTYDAGSGAFTLNVDIQFTINGFAQVEPGLVLTGTVIYVTAANFGTPTGNAYVDNVLIPLAQKNNAASLAFFDGTGTLTNLGFPIRIVVPLLESLFQINPGLNGSWANFATLGQGFFLDVFPTIPLVFLSWFTYDTTQVANTATVGDSNHRWITAQGPFTGDTANLAVTLTTGGLFDDPTPTTNTPEGTIVLNFLNCGRGTVTYNFTAAGVQGAVPISRIANDNVPLCETMDGIND